MGSRSCELIKLTYKLLEWARLQFCLLNQTTLESIFRGVKLPALKTWLFPTVSKRLCLWMLKNFLNYNFDGWRLIIWTWNSGRGSINLYFDHLFDLFCLLHSNRENKFDFIGKTLQFRTSMIIFVQYSNIYLYIVIWTILLKLLHGFHTTSYMR